MVRHVVRSAITRTRGPEIHGACGLRSQRRVRRQRFGIHKPAGDSRLETERHGLGQAIRGNNRVDVIGSRMGRKRLPTAIVAHVAHDALDDGPQLARRGAGYPPRHPASSSSPDRSLTVAVLNRRREPPVDALRSATSDQSSAVNDNSSYFRDGTLEVRCFSSRPSEAGGESPGAYFP